MMVHAAKDPDFLLAWFSVSIVLLIANCLLLTFLSSPIAAQTSPTPKEEEKVSEEEELEIEIGSEEESEVGAEEQVDTDEDVQTEDRTIIFE